MLLCTGSAHVQKRIERSRDCIQKILDMLRICRMLNMPCYNLISLIPLVIMPLNSAPRNAISVHQSSLVRWLRTLNSCSAYACMPLKRCYLTPPPALKKYNAWSGPGPFVLSRITSLPSFLEDSNGTASYTLPPDCSVPSHFYSETRHPILLI